MIRILFLFLFCSQLIIAQNLNNLDFGTDSTFDIISWNIEWFPKNSTTAIKVQEILANLESDIYALQEIDDTTLLKQVVANIPGYECYFKSTYYGGLTYVYNSNTVQINAKYEIFTSQSYWNAFPRSPQILDCTFNGDNYIIINNHFKCCGDGILNINNPTDEENRRLQAITFLKQYIDNNFPSKKVILLGDLNDELIDNNLNNVFQDIILDSSNYSFVDMQIAQSSSVNWSYPTWPSHLDHILITNELFFTFQDPGSLVSVIRVDDYMSSWSDYENNVSDHRPIGLKLNSNILNSISEGINSNKVLTKVVDVLGRGIRGTTKGLLFKLYDDGTVEKKIIIK
jgi:exonuclease III|tara:strand:- start:3594 stop:4619 length:1026 start_codon:yes stop_codon:yes gene_type:complete